MKNRVLNYIRENRMIEAGESVVIGVSGGADSMCLLHMMEEISGIMSLKLAVVHIHHGIRKETAGRDAAFVENYCREHGILCYIKRVDVPALSKQWGMSEEETGRKVRYDAFDEVIKEISEDGKGKIAVAHNADDSAETVLLNLFRGSGIKGMAGILPVRGNVVRPVLCLTRKEIEEYNDKNGVGYVQDETNFVAEYTRNKLRLQILPAIKEAINPKAAEHINLAGQSLAQIDDYMESQCEKIYSGIVSKSPRDGFLYIPADKFNELHIAMQLQLVKKCLYEVAGRAKDITGKHIHNVKNLFSMNVGRSVDLPYNMVAVKEYEGVTIKVKVTSDLADNDDENIQEVVIDGEGRYSLKVDNESFDLTVEKDNFNEAIFIENQYTKWIECDIIDSNLLLRTRRDGDYIIVDEKGSRKKLKDFFIDKKIPREDRNRICLLTRGSEVIWIVGYRLSAAYKVKADSRHIWKLKLTGGDSDEGTC